MSDHLTPDRKPSVPRKLARLGIMGIFASAGVLEFISFAVFGCPCLVEQHVRPEVSNAEKPANVEDVPRPRLLPPRE